MRDRSPPRTTGPNDPIGSIGLVGAGAMGAALGASWRAGGNRVVTTLAGRGARTTRLAAAAGLQIVAGLDDVVAADLVVSVVPPGAAVEVAADIAAAAARTGCTPLVADLNAVAPATVGRVADVLGAAGLRLVDGSISGPPPTERRRTRVYVSGPDAERVAALAAPWHDVVNLGPEVGRASALKMCTASMYKGSTALVMQALLTAAHHGLLDEFLDDTAREWPDGAQRWPVAVALAASKSARFVDEMREIALTQAGAGLPPALFRGVAVAYQRAAATPLGAASPETAGAATELDEVLAGLAAPSTAPAAVLFDFSDTLFHLESPAQVLLAALGPDAVHRAAAVAAAGGINGLDRPPALPAEQADLWARRDLSETAHRAAYTGAAQHAGLTDAEAAAVYERGLAPDAWHPYPDTVRTLRALAERGVPVAIVSNIGWDPRPVLARYGVDRDVGGLVLSYERGQLKPDPAIFLTACAELGVDPARAVMVGDNPRTDGGARAAGLRFVLVDADPARRRPDALARAAGLG